MPVVYKEGKDTIIFKTEEEYAAPSKITLPEIEPSPGLILPSGEINWNCPCLGGMATGPCGVEFREAFSCFHYSTSDPKGHECYDAFKVMQGCMTNYPGLYGNKEMNMDEEIADEEASPGDDMKNLNDSDQVLHLQQQENKTEIVSKK
ncbi:mitochondrial intermembrane space import and assembly protein 40 [Leptopilina heterotoma]|uniref:mitochondrial intermembrane space import and assembly protein 40 n=1 Tax=Leptopilina heterotoma TaxID=63436 RepID=UPI001CA93058|nr:mitochondrial intermembrane space import and assembly protein 40 [Leptopilina heterotoma]